jgi:hypothetical protein
MTERFVSVVVEKCRPIDESRCAPDRLINPFIDQIYVSVNGIFDSINMTFPNDLFQFEKQIDLKHLDSSIQMQTKVEIQ